MEIIRRRLAPWQAQIGLFSDFHIGNPDVDYKQIGQELRTAFHYGSRININGDVFDLILPGDRKRFRADALHKRLQGKADIVNAAVDWGVELLAPFASAIDMIGEGNHETAAEKANSVNVTKLLVERLRQENPNIAYGGYTGFLRYKIDRMYYTIFYHHGAGHASGGEQFKRLSSWVDADLIWIGHRHDRITHGAKRLYCPSRGNNVGERTVRFAMSGSYLHTYRKGALSYGAEKMLSPQDTGCVSVNLVNEGNKLRAELTA